MTAGPLSFLTVTGLDEGEGSMCVNSCPACPACPSMLKQRDGQHTLHAAFLSGIRTPADVLQEPGLLRNAIGFYRLMATWLLRLAYPPLAQGQMPFVPLPEPAPAQFRALPVRLLLQSTRQGSIRCAKHKHTNESKVTSKNPSACSS